jgi:hypothetical protein
MNRFCAFAASHEGNRASLWSPGVARNLWAAAFLGSTLAAAAIGPTSAAAEDKYPSRPVKIVVSLPAGAGPDIRARIVAEPRRADDRRARAGTFRHKLLQAPATIRLACSQRLRRAYGVQNRIHDILLRCAERSYGAQVR